MLKGVFPATKKDGTIYYRTSINYSGKHISLGSFASEEMAHLAYKEASDRKSTRLNSSHTRPSRMPSSA